MTEFLSVDQAFIIKITDIINSNIRNENFSVGNLAREAGMSRITIYRRIKSIRNQNATQFIREIRLRRAMELLQQNAGSVSEVGFMVGFGTPGYFTRCFHQFYGYPPGKVKKSTDQSTNSAAAGPVTVNNGQGNPGRQRLFYHLAGILSFIILLCVGYILFFNRSTTADNPSEKTEISIAVLPFRNLTDSASNQYFVDGIAEEILTNMSMIHDLRVLSRLSTEQYRETRRPATEIARRLKADYIVEGSIQKYTNMINLWVSLTDALKDKQIWSHQYNRKFRQTVDIFGIQSEIAQAIASELEATITPEEKKLIEKTPTTNLTALDFYQRGREELGKFQFHDLMVTSTTYPVFFDKPLDKEAIKKARILFTTALRFDSTFAPAYVELAAINWSENYFREYFSENYLDSVLILANKALSFDARLPDAYYIRAMYYGETGNIKQARIDFDKTLELDPNHWQAYYGKGALYLEEYPDADYTIALDNFLKAASRHHGSARPYLLKRIAYTLNITGFSDLALKYNLEASQLELDSASYYLALRDSYAWSGDPAKADYFLNKAFEKDSNRIDLICYQSGHYAVNNDWHNSLRILRKYLKILKDNGITMVNDQHRIAAVYEKLGIKDTAEYYYRKQIKNCNAAIRLGRPYGLSFAYYDLAIIYKAKGDRKKVLENLNIFKKREGMCFWFGLGDLKIDPEAKKIDAEIYSGYLKEHEKVKKWLEAQGLLSEASVLSP